MASPESASPRADPARGAARIRFDKWLWAARFYRTRALAAQAIDAGQARLAAGASSRRTPCGSATQ